MQFFFADKLVGDENDDDEQLKMRPIITFIDGMDADNNAPTLMLHSHGLRGQSKEIAASIGGGGSGGGSGCWSAGKFYAIGATWNPWIGPLGGK